jgi:aerobic-type carbon monoxide dehydrogenase small subunit (CoxS/CutS family)
MEFVFEGRPVEFEPGLSITAALVRAGSRESGIFCGIGVCFGCVVLVDGSPKRGCITEAKPGEEVTRAV